MTRLRGRRSAHTPAIGEKITEDKTRAAKINPREVASPPASKTVTASAMGKADEPRTKIELEIQRNLKSLYDQSDPASKNFTREDYLTGLALRLAKTWSMRPYSTASAAVRILSRSISRAISAADFVEWRSIISSRSVRMRMISRA
jgi:hypothetical protein